MPNKYELRRRSLKERQEPRQPVRLAAPRRHGAARRIYPAADGRSAVAHRALGLGLFMMITALYVQTAGTIHGLRR